MLYLEKNEILEIIIKRVIVCIILTSFTVNLWVNEVHGNAFSTQSQVLSVALPENINFYLNPHRKYGQDLIYSPRYKIKNMGKRRIVFDMEMTLSELISDTGIVYCAEEDGIWQDTKSIYLYVLMEYNQAQELFVLSEGERRLDKDIILEPDGVEGDALYISFGGKLGREADWKSGEIGVDVFYSMDEVEEIYKLNLEGKHVYLEDSQEEIEGGTQSKVMLRAEEGYSLPSEIRVSMNGKEMSFFEYDSVSGTIVLDKVIGDVTIFAYGISAAELPEEKIFLSGEGTWEWDVVDGIQAYDYEFLQNGVTIKSGRVAVDNDGKVRWKWSEGLNEGEYQMKIKAIGDNVYYTNSEEKTYWLTIGD